MLAVSDYDASPDYANRENGGLVGLKIRFQYRSSSGDTSDNRRVMSVDAHWIDKSGEIVVAGETDIGYRRCKPQSSKWLSKSNGQPSFELLS